MFFTLSMLFSFNIQITSFDGHYRLRLPKVILDGNGVNIVFDEGKDGILEPSYETSIGAWDPCRGAEQKG
jgi:hypothetical protein